MPDAHKEIIKAARSGDLDTIKALLARDPTLVQTIDRDGSTPPHRAAWKGRQPAVVELLRAGADVGTQNRNEHWGTTPLHAAEIRKNRWRDRGNRDDDQ